jgi:hypothetical protein
MKLNEGFVLRQVCGDNVITGEGLGAIIIGKLLALNETAAWLCKEAEAQGEFTVNSLADKLCEEYEVTAEQAHQDVDAIVKKWQEVEVVE